MKTNFSLLLKDAFWGVLCSPLAWAVAPQAGLAWAISPSGLTIPSSASEDKDLPLSPRERTKDCATRERGDPRTTLSRHPNESDNSWLGVASPTQWLKTRSTWGRIEVVFVSRTKNLPPPSLETLSRRRCDAMRRGAMRRTRSTKRRHV